MVTPTATHGPADYQIIIKGKLGDQWSDWFADMTIASDGDVTILTGTHIDQSALHGLLVRNLHFGHFGGRRKHLGTGDQAKVFC